MVDITSLKARLARLRLASDIQEEAKHDRRLEDPVTTERKKYKKKQKKAKGRRIYDKAELEIQSFDPENAPKDSPYWAGLERDRSDVERKSSRRKEYLAKEDIGYGEYTTNTGGKRKKKNKLTRSDQKRGSLDEGYGDYTKNTGGKRKKKNKLTRSDQKRGKKRKFKPKDHGYSKSQTKSPIDDPRGAMFEVDPE
jgi:hypothetical protein